MTLEEHTYLSVYLTKSKNGRWRHYTYALVNPTINLTKLNFIVKTKDGIIKFPRKELLSYSFRSIDE